MLIRLGRKRASSTAEFAILIGVIVGAALAMQTYMKRAWQDRVRQHADGLGGQYEPYYLNQDYHATSDGSVTTTTDLGGEVGRQYNQESNRDGSQTLTYHGE